MDEDDQERAHDRRADSPDLLAGQDSLEDDELIPAAPGN
jgi:hypothetical protein